MKIGIDIGGSHVGIGLVDNDGKIIEKEERYIIQKKGENEYIQGNVIYKENLKKELEAFLIEGIKKIQYENQIQNIGIAVPGTVSEKKIIKSVNLGLENYNLGEILEKNLHIKVKMRNDAKCSALAEQKYGELKQYDNSLFLCIGTGIGGAVIFNRKLLEAQNVPGFEFSHMIIQKNGKLCNCGKRGCFEAYASLKRFKENIIKEFNINTLDGKIIRKFIIQNKDNIRLKFMINEYIENLSIGISNIVNIFEPEVICLGGSFSEYKDIFYENLKSALLKGNLLFNKRDDIILKLAKFKNDAGIIGATI